VAGYALAFCYVYWLKIRNKQFFNFNEKAMPISAFPPLLASFQFTQFEFPIVLLKPMPVHDNSSAMYNLSTYVLFDIDR
jgi:hypothetical protein